MEDYKILEAPSSEELVKKVYDLVEEDENWLVQGGAFAYNGALCQTMVIFAEE